MEYPLLFSSLHFSSQSFIQRFLRRKKSHYISSVHSTVSPWIPKFLVSLFHCRAQNYNLGSFFVPLSLLWPSNKAEVLTAKIFFLPHNFSLLVDIVSPLSRDSHRNIFLSNTLVNGGFYRVKIHSTLLSLPFTSQFPLLICINQRFLLRKICKSAYPEFAYDLFPYFPGHPFDLPPVFHCLLSLRIRPRS